MNKKELITPFLVAALSLLFVAICFMVFLSNGKSKKWVSRKMFIGGLLLSFTAIVQTGCNRGLCYKMVFDPLPEIEDAKVKLLVTKSNIIKGCLKEIYSIYDIEKDFENWKNDNYDSTIISDFIKERMSIASIIEAGPPSFYYEIIMPDSQKVIRQGNLIPSDGKFNSISKENFKIHFDEKLIKGKYILKIYYKNLLSDYSFKYPDPMKIEIDSKYINIRR